MTIRSASWPSGHVGRIGERQRRSFRELQQRRRLRQRAGDRDDRAFGGRRRRAEPATPSSMSLVAGSIQITRLPPNRLIAPASSASDAGSDLIAPAATTNLARAQAPRAAARPARATAPRRGRGTDRSECRRSGWSTERPMWPCSPSLRRGRPATRRAPSRATIWSATMSARFSSAVCSAATVAYSELTMSMPASDPAVASSTTVPLPRSTSW